MLAAIHSRKTKGLHAAPSITLSKLNKVVFHFQSKPRSRPTYRMVRSQTHSGDSIRNRRNILSISASDYTFLALTAAILTESKNKFANYDFPKTLVNQRSL